jgi:hypothetical protein
MGPGRPVDGRLFVTYGLYIHAENEKRADAQCPEKNDLRRYQEQEVD